MFQDRKNVCEKMPILTHFLTLQTPRIDPVPSFVNNEKSLETTQFQGFLYGRGRRIRASASAEASHTGRSATQFLAKFGTRRPLLSKNDILYHFLNAKTLTGSHPSYYTKNKNGHLTASVSIFGRGRRSRTLGTRFWRPLLYQLSYTPVSTFQRPVR